MTDKTHDPEAVKRAFDAVLAEDVDRLRRFLTGGGDPDARNEDGVTLLQYAASKNRYIAATVLLEGAADPNLKSKGSHAYTALHYAAERDNAEMIKLLVQYGAQLDVPDRYKQTPLHVAASEGHPKAVAALVKAGADVFAADGDKRTALEVAGIRKSEVLDFAWQEYIDIENYLRPVMAQRRELTAAFKAAQEQKIGGDISRLKKHNPNRYKLGK